MAQVERHAQVKWVGDPMSGKGTLTGESGAFGTLPITSPSRMGPNDGTVTPEELLASAHAGCYSIALAFVLLQNGTPADDLTVDASYALEMQDGVFKITTAFLDVSASIPKLDAATFDKLARQAEQVYPVSNAVRGNDQVSVGTKLTN